MLVRLQGPPERFVAVFTEYYPHLISVNSRSIERRSASTPLAVSTRLPPLDRPSAVRSSAREESGGNVDRLGRCRPPRLVLPSMVVSILITMPS